MPIWEGRPRAKSVCATAVLAAGALVIAACGSSSGSSGSKGTQNISIVGSFGADFGLVDIAQHGGFFKKEGLNVKLVNSEGFSSAALQSAFLGGKYTFEIGSSVSAVLAVAAGSPFKAVMAMDEGQQQQLAISSQYAQSHNIPDPGPSATAEQTQAQIQALKGTGMTIGISNTSSAAYNDIAADFGQLGVGLGGAALVKGQKSDVVIDALGNTSTLPPALAAGKIDSFSLPPPVSDVKDSTIINLGNVEPVHSATALYMVTLSKIAKSDPALVQKAVDAMVLAWQFAKANPSKAMPMLADVYTANNLTSSDAEAKILFDDDSKYWVTPYLTTSGFQNMLDTLKVGQGKPVNVTYGQWIDDSFVKKAASDLHITVPTSG